MSEARSKCDFQISQKNTAPTNHPRVFLVPKRQLSRTKSLLKNKGSLHRHEVTDSVGGDSQRTQAEYSSGKWGNGDHDQGLQFKSSTFNEALDEGNGEGLYMYDVRDVAVPAVPDGGYGWVVVFASFMCNMTVDGIAYTFGVFLPKYAESFNEGKGTVAWAGSLLCGVDMCVGPIVSALANKYGCRVVCMAGACVGAAGFGLSSLAPNLNILKLTYGVIGGIGFGLIYLPAVVCVGYYFESKRALATGIAVCGSGVGTFAFAPLASWLLQTMGWRGANVVFACLLLSCALYGLLMKPLEVQMILEDEDGDVETCGGGDGGHRPKPQRQEMTEDKNKNYMERGSKAGSAYFMVQLPDGSMERRAKIPVNADPSIRSSFNMDQPVPVTPMSSAPLPALAVLPTITEAKPTDTGTGSSAGSNERANQGSEEDPNKKDTEDSNANTSKSVAGGMSRNDSAPLFNCGRSIPKKTSVPFFDKQQSTATRRPSFRAVPLGTATNKESKASLPQERKGSRSIMNSIWGSIASFMGSKTVNAASVKEDTVNSPWSKADLSEGLLFCSSQKSVVTQEHRQIIRPMSRKDIFYTGSIVNLPEYKCRKSMSSYRQSGSGLNFLRESSKAELEGYGSQEKEEGAFKSVLGQLMDFSLLANPVFLLIAISNVFGMMGFYVPFVYLIDVAVMKGVDADKAAFLLSIIGVTNTVGRVLSGMISDLPQVNSLFMNNTCLFVSGLCVLSVPFCGSSYEAYVVMALFFGLFISAYISLTSIILVDLLGLENLTTAFGLLTLFRGLAGLVGAPLAGAMFDQFKSYDVSFYLAGGFLLISSLISFLVPLVTSCAPEKSFLQPSVQAGSFLEDIPEAAESKSNSDSRVEKYDPVCVT